jgi:hypothetical protein
MPIRQYGLYMAGIGRAVVAAASTAVQLSTTSVPCQWVNITALATSSGVVVIGTSTVVATASSRAGIPITAGLSALIPVQDLNAVYIDSTAANDGVTFAYYTQSVP